MQLSKYRLDWIEISHDLVEFGFLLLLVCAALFCPAVFEISGLRTDNHSDTCIDKFDNFVHQATCSAMVKTAIDSSALISTTQIVQTKRHQTGL